MISSDHLKPGDTGRIKATVNTAGKSGFLAKHLSVYSNDRTMPVVTLEMDITVAPK